MNSLCCYKESPNNYGLYISSVQLLSWDTSKQQAKCCETEISLRLIKPYAMGEKLHGWIFSVAGVRSTELDADFICIVNSLIPK